MVWWCWIILGLSIPLEMRVDHINWAPLEKLFSVNECQNFMGMGQVRCSRGIVLHLYKHRQTRRYLNLDAYGNAYRFRSGSQELPHTYEAIEPHEAKHHVLSQKPQIWTSSKCFLCDHT